MMMLELLNCIIDFIIKRNLNEGIAEHRLVRCIGDYQKLDGKNRYIKEV